MTAWEVVEYNMDQGHKCMDAAEMPNITLADREYYLKRAEVYYKRAELTLKLIEMTPSE